MPARPYIAVIGASQPSPEQEQAAEDIGRGLGGAGCVVITGGRGGVMAAASRGAGDAGATVIGILPGSDRREANQWVEIALPTGLGDMRNALVVRAADAVIAVGGAYGTLSEIAHALNEGIGVVGYDTWGIEGIELADTPAAAVERALELAADAEAA
ncbi:MAG TPA: TIGR00725 family protein [Solirubrobacteraceae bacterium]|nr:TIGR00725 family protein [Solirubrobacteraceae bacterium]